MKEVRALNDSRRRNTALPGNESDPRNAAPPLNDTPRRNAAPRLNDSPRLGAPPWRNRHAFRARAALLPAVLPALVALALAACADSAPATTIPGADPARGRRLVAQVGCGACHQVPGIHDGDGTVGPPLTEWNRRAFIAGVLPNSPAYLVRWIMTPQAVVPGNAMPDMGINQRDATDIAAYLYSIR